MSEQDEVEDNIIRLSEEADLIGICAAQNAASVVPKRTSPSTEEVNRYSEFLNVMEKFADTMCTLGPPETVRGAHGLIKNLKLICEKWGHPYIEEEKS
jgi:hypothetical protein